MSNINRFVQTTVNCCHNATPFLSEPYLAKFHDFEIEFSGSVKRNQAVFILF